MGRAAGRRVGRVAARAARGTANATKKGEPWTDRAARAGYVARGSVYVLVGGIALAAAAEIGRAHV